MGLLDVVLNTDLMRAPAQCIIRVDGAEITDFYAYLKELRVDMSRRAATVATLVFDTMRDENGQWLIQDAGLFRPWKEIELVAEFDPGHTETIMHGYIKDVRADLPQEKSAASVTITAQDDSILLDRVQGQGQESDEDTPMSDGQVVTRLVSAVPTLAVDADQGMTVTQLNRNSPPVQLIRERADANGFEFHVRDGIVYFKAQQLTGAAQQPTIMLYAGRATNCLSFAVHFDGHLPDQVRITRAADSGSDNEEETFSPDLPLFGTTPVGSDAMGLEPYVHDLQQISDTSWEEARVQAQARANEYAWKVIAEGELDGSLYGHVLLTHQTVAVDGAGEIDDGIYYVDEVTHRFSVDGYRQQFKLIRNATGETAMVS
jgi:hypothetical protein